MTDQYSEFELARKYGLLVPILRYWTRRNLGRRQPTISESSIPEFKLIKLHRRSVCIDSALVEFNDSHYLAYAKACEANGTG